MTRTLTLIIGAGPFNLALAAEVQARCGFPGLPAAPWSSGKEHAGGDVPAFGV